VTPLSNDSPHTCKHISAYYPTHKIAYRRMWNRAIASSSGKFNPRSGNKRKHKDEGYLAPKNCQGILHKDVSVLLASSSSRSRSNYTGLTITPKRRAIYNTIYLQILIPKKKIMKHSHNKRHTKGVNRQ
jgi:hypothetical protein